MIRDCIDGVLFIMAALALVRLLGMLSVIQ